MGLVKYSTASSSSSSSKTKMEALFSFLQNLFVFVFLLGDVFPLRAIPRVFATKANDETLSGTTVAIKI